jgi:tetratricopeptide (TPR) repeat protein
MAMLDYDAYIQRAELLRQQHRIKDAEQQLAVVLQANPNHGEALQVLAHCKIDSKKYTEAKSILKQCLQNDANNDYAFYLLAFAHYHENENIQAKKFLNKAISIFPYNDGYFALLAHILLDEKDYQLALNTANDGLAINPESLSCLNARSTALFRLNKKDEAYETINEALSIDPEDYATHANYGWHYLEKGRHQQAATHFKEALRNNPNYEYAKEGYKAALKSKLYFYRWLLQFNLWMSKQKSGFRIGMIIGVWLLIRLISMLTADSALRAIGITIVVIYFLVAMLTWLGSAIANLYLLFTPHGKYILNNSEQWRARLIGIALGVGLILYCCELLFQIPLTMLAILIASLSIPLTEIEFPIKLFRGKSRVIIGHILLTLAALMILSIPFHEDLPVFFGVLYMIFFIGFMWTGTAAGF